MAIRARAGAGARAGAKEAQVGVYLPSFCRILAFFGLVHLRRCSGASLSSELHFIGLPVLKCLTVLCPNQARNNSYGNAAPKNTCLSRALSTEKKGCVQSSNGGFAFAMISLPVK